TSGYLVNITMSNNGTGYTSAPTITLNGGGGTGAAATATVIGGEVRGWKFTGNGIFGTSINISGSYPNTNGDVNNFSAQTIDQVGFKDYAGELFGLTSTSPYHGIATDGSDPGVNYAALSGITDYVPVDATLTDYWKFDEGAGTSVADAIGTKNLTINGTS